MTRRASQGAANDVLRAELPRRWGRAQRAKNTAIYWLIRAAYGVVRLFPLERGVWAAGPVGRLAWWLSPAHRRQALDSLAQALPELSPARRRRVARASFVHLARTAFETVRQDRLLDSRAAPRMDAAQHALIEEALAEGKGIVIVSGHIGNWELIPAIVGRAGFPISVVGKPLYDPRLTRWVHGLRSREGIEVLWRGDAGMMRGLLGVFRRGRGLGLLIDQDTDVQGVFVPFFGRPAYTPTAAAALALHVRAPVLVCWLQRRGGSLHLEIERVEPPTSGDSKERIRDLTADLTARLERAIRQAPEQWVWMHQRWKRREPPADS